MIVIKEISSELVSVQVFENEEFQIFLSEKRCNAYKCYDKKTCFGVLNMRSDAIPLRNDSLYEIYMDGCLIEELHRLYSHEVTVNLTQLENLEKVIAEGKKEGKPPKIFQPKTSLFKA